MDAKKQLLFILLAFVVFASCKKETINNIDGFTYYQIGFKSSPSNWRDTAFIVRSKDVQLINKADLQLTLPIAERQLIVGELARGSGGYNKNATHEFKWHSKEEGWNFADVTIEIYDGTPYSDIDKHLNYWINTVKAYGPWSSYIKRKLTNKPN